MDVQVVAAEAEAVQDVGALALERVGDVHPAGPGRVGGLGLGVRVAGDVVCRAVTSVVFHAPPFL